MTTEEREEALAIMNVIIHMIEKQYDNDRVEKAVDMAIAALKAEPCEDCDKWETDKTACQKCGEPCGDAVKRESVLNTLDTMNKALDEGRTVEHYKDLLTECYKALPPVTPKPLDSVLDEIRAEIEKLPSELTYDGRRMIRRVRVYDIIDKYKTGSEG